MFKEKENNLTESGSRAELECRQALARSGYAFIDTPASFHWSQLINPRGDKYAALQAYQDLLAVEPENKSALEGIAYLYQILGMFEDAALFRARLRQVEAREYGIDNEHLADVVNYLLARTGDANSPEEVPLAYTKAHFDRYAENFEEHLLQKLNYKGADLVADQVKAFVENLTSSRLLDLGCGTGLLGKALGGQVENLSGVDLSEKMLEKAEAAGVYTELYCKDINSFLRSDSNSYTMITAADVFIYTGDLSNIFEAAQKRLSPGGYFIFTVEKTDNEQPELRNTGRYQHSQAYIESLAKKHAYSIVKFEQIAIREEAGQAVESLLFVLQK